MAVQISGDDRQALEGPLEIRGAPELRVHGVLRSYAQYLGERMSGGFANAVHGLLIRTGMLTPVSKWRGLAPPRARLPLPRTDRRQTEPAAFRVAPGVVFQAADAPSPSGCAAACGPSLWVSDVRTGLSMAYAVEDELEALAALAPGAPATGLSPELFATLVDVGALRPAEPGDVPPIDAERARLAGEFEAEGFVLVRDLVPPGLLAALRAHYHALPAQVRLEADLFSGRLVEKNEPVARHLLRGFSDLVGALAQRTVQPSYCFSMWYAPGARLRVHRDNALCEYTLNLVIDQQPPRPSHWPLCMMSRRGRITEVNMRPGDALLFRGRELAHFRRRLRDKGNAIGVLLHYVNDDFAGDLAAAGAYD
jgi:hypothetical protein